ncbi:MAG TPA: FtsX-like permease family protein [Puia sp.]|nr:FtsX-like permease family protein [Puia sp.]
MLKNHFAFAWRNLRNNKTFTLLNLGGLAISFTASLVIFIWVKNELSYDRTGLNADRVYRVALTLQAKGQPDKKFAVTAGPLGPVLVKDFPEVEKSVRFEPYAAMIGYQQNHFFSNKFLFADSSFFDVFGLSLLEGNPHTALDGGNSVVITETMAKKIFGEMDPLGKIITCSDSIPLIVTGVAPDLPATSHFHFELVCSFRVLEAANIDDVSAWWDDDFYTYVLLHDKFAAATVAPKLVHIMDKYNGANNRALGFEGLHFLQPLTGIHLNSHLYDEIESNGSLVALRIFIAISIFLLVIACINYINLTTANSFKRAKEIGVRKVAGAMLAQLMGQFLAESVLIACIALIFSFGAALLCMPLFNQLASTQISMLSEFSWWLICPLIGFATLLGIVAGIYPALYLSRLKPVIALKQGVSKKSNLFSLRKMLVVFQFTLSVILIIATIVAFQQLRYMQKKDLGFTKEQVIAIPMRTQDESNKLLILKKEFEKNAGVSMVTASAFTPGRVLANNIVLPEGGSRDHLLTMNNLVVDFDFINVYQISMAAGRPFNRDFPTDSSAFLLNEAAVRDIGWPSPGYAVGKKFEWGLGKKGKVIGVVKDFHFNSLQQKVPPMVMQIMPPQSGWYGFLSARLNVSDVRQIVKSMQQTWKSILPDHPFEYFFVDEDYNKQYRAEQRLGNLSIVFSILTIFISCLGLFGLVIVAVNKRTKEIGVRRVLGASAVGITALVAREFLQLVTLSIIIATPIGWIMVNKWLADFAYRMEIHWWVFAISAFLAIAIAVITISARAIRAATSNPVNCLRSE